MSLSTIIDAEPTRPARPVHALVLMGGGARTAYQVGVLRAMASILKLQAKSSSAFPFQVLVGTSAGALNAAYLASAATRGLEAFDWLGQCAASRHFAAANRGGPARQGHSRTGGGRTGSWWWAPASPSAPAWWAEP
jgi:hypothetical protein